MAKRHFTSRRELEEHHFSPAVLISVPLVALFLGAYLPKLWLPLSILDLPLIVVIYFAVSLRAPAAGAVFGAVVGLLQDLPTNHYIGVFGITKTIVGYMAASIGLRVDVENPVTRLMMNFGFCLLQSVMLFVMGRLLFGASDMHANVLHEFLRAIINSLVAIPLFLLLDQARADE